MQTKPLTIHVAEIFQVVHLRGRIVVFVFGSNYTHPSWDVFRFLVLLWELKQSFGFEKVRLENWENQRWYSTDLIKSWQITISMSDLHLIQDFPDDFMVSRHTNGMKAIRKSQCEDLDMLPSHSRLMHVNLATLTICIILSPTWI